MKIVAVFRQIPPDISVMIAALRCLRYSIGFNAQNYGSDYKGCGFLFFTTDRDNGAADKLRVN